METAKELLEKRENERAEWKKKVLLSASLLKELIKRQIISAESIDYGKKKRAEQGKEENSKNGVEERKEGEEEIEQQVQYCLFSLSLSPSVFYSLDYFLPY